MMNRRHRTIAALGRVIADLRLSVERHEDMARDANRAACLAMDERDEFRREVTKMNHELRFLYSELSHAQRLATADIQHRVCQLAARVNPEGRAYEGPEAV